MSINHIPEEVFQTYLEGRLREGKKELEEHLQNCNYCRTQFQAYQAVYHRLNDRSEFVLSANFTDKVMSKIETGKQRHFNWTEIVLFFLGIIFSVGITIYYSDSAIWGRLVKDSYFKNVKAFEIVIHYLENFSQQFGLNISIILVVVILLLIFAFLDKLLFQTKYKRMI